MKNIFIFSDFHILESELVECSLVAKELLSLSRNCDTIIDLGDTLDSIEPTSLELDFLSEFFVKLNKPIISIAAQSHESKSKEDTIKNHLAILNKKIKIVKEFIDNDLYYGHFIIKEAKKGKFGATISLNDLKQYIQVFLGHQHSFEQIKNVTQLGSVRFISFDEVTDKDKKVAIIQNYGIKDQKMLILPLKSPYPMKVYHLSSLPTKPPQNQLYNLNMGIIKQELDQLSPKTKIKIIIEDFTAFKNWIGMEQIYKSKFYKFSRENNFKFSTSINLQEKKEVTDLRPALEDYLKIKKVDKEVSEILLKEIK